MSAENLVTTNKKDLLQASGLIVTAGIALGVGGPIQADNTSEYQNVNDDLGEGLQPVNTQGFLLNLHTSNQLSTYANTRMSFQEFAQLVQSSDPDVFRAISEKEVEFSGENGIRDTFRLGDSDFGVYIASDEAGLVFAVPDIRSHELDASNNEIRTHLLIPHGSRLLLIDDYDGNGDTISISYNVDPSTGIAYPLRETKLEDGTVVTELMVVDDNQNESMIEIEEKDQAPSVVGQVKDGISSVNLRSGPGTENSILRGLSRGTTFMVIGENESGTWYEIYVQGERGWIRSDLVEKLTENEAETPEPEGAPIPNEDGDATEPAPRTPEFFESWIDVPITPQAVDAEGRYFGFISRDYLIEEANASLITLDQRAVTVATSEMYNLILQQINAELSSNGKAPLVFEDPVTLKTLFPNDPIKRENKEIKGQIEKINHYIVSWDELKQIKDSIDLDNEKFLELYSNISGGNINRGLAYFNDHGDFVLVTAPFRRYDRTENYQGLYPARDSLVTAYLMVRDAIIAGNVRLASKDFINANAIYESLGCNDGNQWCSTNSPSITLTPQN